ncbi:hypothetical protein F7725_015954 [Dissostichus mawsoni]|uniref:Uncharacterized protein n=1 Tax=Dissostichus mawsoni TaxID=36200 RepID=A0A7J5Y3A1_DISMA|nr:hypothetical protein F7725_015954 [Dissostichus mawsoni]
MLGGRRRSEVGGKMAAAAFPSRSETNASSLSEVRTSSGASGTLGAHLSLQEMRGSAGCEIAVVIAPRPRGLQPIRSPVSSLMEPRRLETNPHHTVKDVDVLDRGSSPWSEAVSRQLHPITSDNDLGIERPTDWLNRKQGSGQKVIALGVTTQVP